jgi:KH domain.
LLYSEIIFYRFSAFYIRSKISILIFLYYRKENENTFKEPNLSSDDPSVWEEIPFLNEQDFGLIIGKKRQTINYLQREFDIKLLIDNKEKKVKIRGKKGRKSAAIEEIRYVIKLSFFFAKLTRITYSSKLLQLRC